MRRAGGVWPVLAVATMRFRESPGKTADGWNHSNDVDVAAKWETTVGGAVGIQAKWS